MSNNEFENVDEHEQARILYYRACIAEFQQLGYQEAFLDEVLRQQRALRSTYSDPNPLQNE
ncbi:hypothetical protein [Pseudoalteromonas piscicida]|uniref:hypothetical protein n=1 Tax=Pseudoalteromonas piscicida TaxID=43662 RepID=UPI0027E55804|nr:hypothetical protein [Pseudoalteromonas piscicida]WMO12803.1 hypothetical protein NI376_11975 [Pseudoalteromonas piscicida]